MDEGQREQKKKKAFILEKEKSFRWDDSNTNLSNKGRVAHRGARHSGKLCAWNAIERVKRVLGGTDRQDEDRIALLGVCLHGLTRPESNGTT